MTQSPQHEASGADNTDAVARLMRTAGRREDPPPATYERTLTAATAVWQAKVRRRAQRRWSAAAAAALLIAIAFVFAFVQPSLPPQHIAALTDRIIGVVELRSGSGGWVALNGDALALRAQDRVRTQSASRAGLMLAGGASLRMAESTDILLESASRVRVLNGKVYVDTRHPHGNAATSRVEIVTTAGVSVDVGTQFEVQYRDEAYRLRVREGRVRLARDAGVIESIAGEQLSIDASGAVERGQLHADDDDWGWVQDVAPAPEIDGRPLMVLLVWVARETGRTLNFATPEAERRARMTILHGSIRLLGPLDALAVMLATTDLEHMPGDDDTILIRLRMQ